MNAMMTFIKHKGRILLDRWFASTKTCSHCGQVQKVSLDERTYVCEECGFTIDRDWNAAINIRKEGKRIYLDYFRTDAWKCCCKNKGGRMPGANGRAAKVEELLRARKEETKEIASNMAGYKDSGLKDKEN